MMEASLILLLENEAVNIENNINWTVSTDYGGEGPRHDPHLEHFVYVAVKPLLRRLEDEAAAASALRHEEYLRARAAGISAQQHDEQFGTTAVSALLDEHFCE